LKRQLKRPKILLGVLVTLALVVSAFALAVPAMALPIPPDANANEIGIGIMTGPGGPYYYGDTILYTVRVYVPAASGEFRPAQQTDIEVHLVLPDENDINLGTIAVLDPGDSYAFPAESYVIDPLDVEEMALLDVVVAEAYCDGTAQLDPTVPSGADVQIATPVVYEELVVSKTVETSYIRTHLWDIEKWVETENGHTIGEEEIPKIWLYEDGSGDETATWWVCVTYLGFEDSDHNVSGTVTIENTGTEDARITDIQDYLGGVPITLDCGVTLPYILEPGQTLVCTYDEDGEFTGENEVTVFTDVDDYGASEDIVWGDPDEEYLDVVDIQDVSDLFGTQLLGTLNAADLDEGEIVCFDYDRYFAWTDYDAPGPYIYENTATIVQTGQSADAILDVNWMEPAELGDFVWDDENQDGIQDAGELGIAGVTVNLYDCGGTPLGTTTTDANGYYLFDMLMPGDYQVEFILPGDYVFSPQYQGADPALDSNADTVTGFSECVTLAAGDSNLTIDAGMYMPPGGEGCTPGFWKNNADKKHAVAWVPTGYSPSDKFSDVFGVVITVRAGGRRTITDPTLLQALKATGGGVDALARHAVAALLNAAHPLIAYGIGNPAGVIALVHDALTSPDPDAIGDAHTLLAGYNEAGCPINQKGEPE
jgi:hypothetical protein